MRLRSLLALVLSSAAYGFSLGIAHDLLYALRNLVKFPLLILATAVLCALSYHLLACVLRTDLGFAVTQGFCGRMYRDLSVLLCSLVPVNLFLAWIMVRTDDGWLGEYDLFLGLNVAFIALAGALVLARHGRVLLRTRQISARRATLLLGAWLAMTSLVGGQAAFFCRPLFGLPATRGSNPPWFLGARADVRGATNFYEVVIQILASPPLSREALRAR